MKKNQTMKRRGASIVLSTMTVMFLLALSVPVLSSTALIPEFCCQMAAQVGRQELVHLGKLGVLAVRYMGSYIEFQRYYSDLKVAITTNLGADQTPELRIA